MTSFTHYEILGVDKTATLDDIRAGYRKVVRLVHPDNGGNSALFGIVQEAYNVLSNDVSRRAYDGGVPAAPSTTHVRSAYSNHGKARKPQNAYTPSGDRIYEHVRNSKKNDAYRRAKRRAESYQSPTGDDSL